MQYTHTHVHTHITHPYTYTPIYTIRIYADCNKDVTILNSFILLNTLHVFYIIQARLHT